jgi:hypothetical protein
MGLGGISIASGSASIPACEGDIPSLDVQLILDECKRGFPEACTSALAQRVVNPGTESLG